MGERRYTRAPTRHARTSITVELDGSGLYGREQATPRAETAPALGIDTQLCVSPWRLVVSLPICQDTMPFIGPGKRNKSFHSLGGVAED